MPAPGTVAEFLDLVQKSGVADEARLTPYLAQLSSAGALPSEPSKAAGLLVRDGLLTYFQAEQILQGKWKRFSIGKYKVLERLGSGGMGQVFLCEHKLMRRRVAVKVLPTAKASDEASLGRFYREARAVAAVDHPNIVRAFDIDQDENLHFLVMEYVDGTNLQDLVKKFGPIDILRACHYIYGAAVGLQHAHEIGLIHRDIKPGNILLDRSGVVKILDMGLARFFHDDADELTKKYDENILGTADYLSPEQAEDSHKVDIRTDIYSLGATFYFLLTSSQPFPEGSIPQKLIWHRSREPRPIKSLRADVPDEIAAIVAKMMAKNPDERYQTPSELMAALAPWVATPIPPPPEREMPQLSPALAGMVGAGMSRGGSVAVPAPRSAAATGPLIGTTPGSAPPVPGTGTASMAGAPTLTGTAPPQAGWSGTPPPTPDPANPPASEVWDLLGDTPVATSSTTGPAAPAGKERDYRPAGPKESPRRKWLVPAAIGGGLVLAGIIALVVYLLMPPPRPEEPPEPPPSTHRLVVSRSKTGDNLFPTLAAAIRSAKAGDTIVIEEPALTEPTIRLGRGQSNITIESGLPNGRPVIEFTAPGGGPNLPVIDVREVENVRFRNIDMDGNGVAEFGINVNGNAPGALFEGVTIRGIKRAGVRLLNAAGQPARPIVFDRIRVVLSQTCEAGLKVDADPTLSSKEVVIRGSRFEGLGRASGIGFQGVVSHCEVTGCRFFRLASAIMIGRAPEGQPVEVRIAENTFFDTKIGLHFLPPPKGGVPGTYAVDVTRNYFHRTPDLAVADGGPVSKVTSRDNGHSPPDPKQPKSKLTPVPLQSKVVKGVKFASPSPNDGAFLQFADGKRPTVGPDDVEIGAP